MTMHIPTSKQAERVPRSSAKDTIGALARDEAGRCSRSEGLCDSVRDPLEPRSSRRTPPPYLDDGLNHSIDPEAARGPRGSDGGGAAHVAKAERQVARAAENGGGESELRRPGWWARLVNRLRGMGHARDRSAKTRPATPAPPHSAPATLTRSAPSDATSWDLAGGVDDAPSPRRHSTSPSRRRSSNALTYRTTLSSTTSASLPHTIRSLDRAPTSRTSASSPRSQHSTGSLDRALNPYRFALSFSTPCSTSSGIYPHTSTLSFSLPLTLHRPRTPASSFSLSRSISFPERPQSSTPFPHRPCLSLARATSTDGLYRAAAEIDSRVGIRRAATEIETTPSPWTFMPEPPRGGRKSRKKTHSVTLFVH
ncbi:hypothetical protein BDK51DRAFT_52368 [Blyttiomyces helicus]|uniref:Uncharacterized protein n=1 Tax=Blyttiomyces helicus TaxID=388810 RepID=A0A4P9WLR9_9FUNG|nr:hypothetical protein BDK51DRAFT_52368 [Blyttiomyces helicus]|eukprot:RKO91606.1 hypothetical protein BDK51DRAFT_52368 [Blyttiomyces helicus]